MGIPKTQEINSRDFTPARAEGRPALTPAGNPLESGFKQYQLQRQPQSGRIIDLQIGGKSYLGEMSQTRNRLQEIHLNHQLVGSDRRPVSDSDKIKAVRPNLQAAQYLKADRLYRGQVETNPVLNSFIDKGLKFDSNTQTYIISLAGLKPDDRANLEKALSKSGVLTHKLLLSNDLEMELARLESAPGYDIVSASLDEDEDYFEEPELAENIGPGFEGLNVENSTDDFLKTILLELARIDSIPAQALAESPEDRKRDEAVKDSKIESAKMEAKKIDRKLAENSKDLKRMIRHYLENRNNGSLQDQLILLDEIKVVILEISQQINSLESGQQNLADLGQLLKQGRSVLDNETGILQTALEEDGRVQPDFSALLKTSSLQDALKETQVILSSRQNVAQEQSRKPAKVPVPSNLV